MKKFKLTRETILLAMITLLSLALNIINLSIEGTANSYYAAAVKSMTVNFKNFFFVAFDPTGFVSIDKPPVGFWLQAISAKFFGFSGWSIILPQALAGVASVVILYFIVKRSFGPMAGLISALCLAVTPVFVAASRNNTVDNILLLVLLLACWALSIAAEKGKFKYLILSMILVGIGFNVKMVQAYMILPALYITYLLATSVSIKKRIIHLVTASFILIAVSLSWAIVVDLVPASNRPYVDSSTDNSVMELIIGHNGLERINLLTNSKDSRGGPGGSFPSRGEMPPRPENSNSTSGSSTNNAQMNQMVPDGYGPIDSYGGPGGADGLGRPGGNGGPGGFGGNGGPGSPSGFSRMGDSNLQGTFGGEVKAGITRLFQKSILSDQIVWFIILAVFGFVAATIKEKLRFRLDNKRKQSLILWFMWFLPSFIYFSFNTGTWHSYYLTMMAPPVAALAGIGITTMWEMYKDGGWKSWFLPVSLIANGIVHLIMLSYFKSLSTIVTVLMVLLLILCFGASVVLGILNVLTMIKKKSSEISIDQDNLAQRKILKIKQALLALAVAGLIITPLVGSSAVMFRALSSSFPAAGLELLSSSQGGGMPKMNSNFFSNKNSSSEPNNNKNSGLIEFLKKNKTQNQKYLLVVSSSNDGAEIILNSDESVMSLGGFLGNNNPLTLDEFKALVKKGEVRYVMGGGNGGKGNSNSEIMNWVKEVGTVVSSSEYSSSDTKNDNPGGFGGGRDSGGLYDLKGYTDS